MRGITCDFCAQTVGGKVPIAPSARSALRRVVTDSPHARPESGTSSNMHPSLPERLTRSS